MVFNFVHNISFFSSHFLLSHPFRKHKAFIFFGRIILAISPSSHFNHIHIHSATISSSRFPNEIFQKLRQLMGGRGYVSVCIELHSMVDKKRRPTQKTLGTNGNKTNYKMRATQVSVSKNMLLSKFLDEKKREIQAQVECKRDRFSCEHNHISISKVWCTLVFVVVVFFRFWNWTQIKLKHF